MLLCFSSRSLHCELSFPFRHCELERARGNLGLGDEHRHYRVFAMTVFSTELRICRSFGGLSNYVAGTSDDSSQKC